MASEVDIAKIALSLVGDRWDITSLSDATPEAEQVDLVFDLVRDALLKEHPWKFAKRFVSPTALASTVTIPDNWSYGFDYPATALKINYIVNDAGRDAEPIKFDVGVLSDNSKIIMTDMEEPTFCFTYAETDATVFPPHFVRALAARLAAVICVPLTGDRGLRDDLLRDAEIEAGTAMTEDANEGVEPEQTRDPDWIKARA